MSPIFIATFEFMSLTFIGFYEVSKSKWGTMRKETRIRNLIFVIAFIVIIIDNIFAILMFSRPFISNIMRPLVYGTFVNLVRLNFKEFYQSLHDSAQFLIAMFSFVFAYSLIGVYLFRYSYEGFNYFSSFRDSVYNMVILMSTANFPDIMLPAYH